MREEMDISLHPNNMSWESGFPFCKLWKSLFYFTKRRKQKAFSKDRVIFPLR
jgi:hypothetical protein